MIKLRTNQTQNTNEPVKKSVNQAAQQVEDQDEEQGSDLINIKKKDKKEEKKKVTKQQSESVWQQEEDNNVKLNKPIPKAVEVKKVFNLSVLKGQEGQAIVTQEEEFPDLDQMMSQPQQKKPTVQPTTQVVKEQPTTITSSAGKSAFQNSKKGVTIHFDQQSDVTPFAIAPIQQQAQQQQPVASLNVNTGPVTFKHTNKDEKKTVLEQPTPPQPIVPVQIVQAQPEAPIQIITRQQIVPGQQEAVIVPPKQIRFQNSNPDTTNQQVLVPQPAVAVVATTTEEIKVAPLNFKAPTSFQNTAKKETKAPVITEAIQQPIQIQQPVQTQQPLRTQQPTQTQTKVQEQVVQKPQAIIKQTNKQDSDDEWDVVVPKIKATHKK